LLHLDISLVGSQTSCIDSCSSADSLADSSAGLRNSVDVLQHRGTLAGFIHGDDRLSIACLIGLEDYVNRVIVAGYEFVLKFTDWYSPVLPLESTARTS